MKSRRKIAKYNTKNKNKLWPKLTDRLNDLNNRLYIFSPDPSVIHCLWYPLNFWDSSSPLSRWRQLLHFLLLHLVVHLGGFVKQALQVAIGTLEGGLWLDASNRWNIMLRPVTYQIRFNFNKTLNDTQVLLTSAGSSRLLQHCRTCSLPVCPVGWKAFLYTDGSRIG